VASNINNTTNQIMRTRKGTDAAKHNEHHEQNAAKY